MKVLGEGFAWGTWVRVPLVLVMGFFFLLSMLIENFLYVQCTFYIVLIEFFHKYIGKNKLKQKKNKKKIAATAKRNLLKRVLSHEVLSFSTPY